VLWLRKRRGGRLMFKLIWGMVWGMVWGVVWAGGEAGGGEGVGVVLLDPLGHFFADQAAKVEVFAGVARAHETAELHGAVGKVGDLETADLFVPERRRVDDGFELLAKGFDWD